MRPIFVRCSALNSPPSQRSSDDALSNHKAHSAAHLWRKRKCKKHVCAFQVFLRFFSNGRGRVRFMTTVDYWCTIGPVMFGFTPETYVSWRYVERPYANYDFKFLGRSEFKPRHDNLHPLSDAIPEKCVKSFRHH